MTGDPQYDRCASDAAAAVISAYSTSFSLATRLLGRRVRPRVREIYALVRVADEIVDGAAAAAGVPPVQQRMLLDAFEEETLAAIDRGFSTDLIVHAFALTARSCGIGAELVRPFFASMRSDLDVRVHDDASHDAYVYGSAEVVGLMCLQVFQNAGRPEPTAPSPHLVDGARRLGAAFQDINFLRDRTDDSTRLGRDYLGIDGIADRLTVLARIDADLAAAHAVIPGLPADCRRAVATAHGLFAALAHRLRTADDGVRVRVPGPQKLGIALRACAVPSKSGATA